MNGFVDRETLELINETAAKAKGAADKFVTVQPEAEPSHVYYRVGPNGDATRIEATPDPRNHKLSAMDQVAPFVTHVRDDDGGEDVKPAVWYSESNITVVADDNVRRGRAVLQLNKTPQLRVLEKLETEAPLKLDQRQFIRLLRVDLKGCLFDLRLLAMARDCKFQGSGSQGGQIQHGRESLGTEIEAAAVTGVDEFPEQVELSVRIFDDPSLTDTWPIVCAVELHVQEARFELIPFPLELRNAIDRELNVVGQLLADQCPKDTPIFRGEA